MSGPFKELLAKVSLLTFARLAGVGFTFLTTLLITRQFGTDGLATYATAFAAMSIVAVVMLFGFHAFAPMLAARYQAQDRSDALHGFVRAGWRLIAVGCAVLLTVWATITFWVPNGFDVLSGPVAVFVVLTAPGLALVLFHGGILSGLQRQAEAQLPDSLLRPLLVLGCVAVAGVIGSAYSINGLLLNIGLVVWLTALVQMRFLRKALQDHPADAPTRDASRWRRLAAPWMTIALIWDYGVDVFLLFAAMLAQAPEIALLFVCLRYRSLAGFGMRSIYAVMQPKIYRAVTQEDALQTQRALALTNFVSMAYALPVFVALWAIGPWLLALFDPSFAAGQGVLLIVALSFVVRAFFGPALALLSTHEKQMIIAGTLLISLLGSLVVCWLLYPVLGLTAIAWAYTGSTAVAALALWWLARGSTGFDSSLIASIWFFVQALRRAKLKQAQVV